MELTMNYPKPAFKVLVTRSYLESLPDTILGHFYGEITNMKFTFICILILVSSLSGVALGQTVNKQTSEKYNRLPPALEPVNCESAIRYIDNALERANEKESNLIVIIKMKELKSFKLGRTRLDNVKRYIRFRGFKEFEVAVNLDADKTEQVELYIQGELLYSLPIEGRDKLDFSVCVVGPKI
jgi:hypothetical protein